MLEIEKGSYGRNAEEALLYEMCLACRQWGVEIPIRELAGIFEKALTKAGREICARSAIRTVSCPVSDWKLEKSLAFLKLANLGVENRDANLINRIIRNALNSRD